MSYPVKDQIVRTRADLEATLDAIEDKLNVSKQVGELRDKAVKSYEKNPLPWWIGAAAAAVTVAAVVAWAILSDDD
jgi:hypothetical protein